MNLLDRTLRVHMARHAGAVPRRSNAGRSSLVARGAQWMRFACLHAQPDIGQPIQVVVIEISASSGPLTCVPSQTVEHLIGEDQRWPPGGGLQGWQRGIGSRPSRRAGRPQASREAATAGLTGWLCCRGVLPRPRWAAGLRTRLVAGRSGSVILKGTQRAPWREKQLARGFGAGSPRDCRDHGENADWPVGLQLRSRSQFGLVEATPARPTDLRCSNRVAESAPEFATAGCSRDRPEQPRLW